MTKRSIELIFFDAGGGHRAAAEALNAVLCEKYPQWDVRVTNLQEILKSADPLFILTGVPSQNFYNAALKMGLTYGSRPFLRGLQTIIKICASRIEDILKQHWETENERDPLDAVVSLIPNFNGVMFRALRAVRPLTPFITIMTDMADSPPHFWQEKQDQYIICGTALAAKQASTTGWYNQEKIYQTSGMILRPSFYKRPSKSLNRTTLGLDENKVTALIMFGGYGSSQSEIIVDKLNKAKLDLQMIVMCGKNERLYTELQAKPNCHAVGYTKDIADYMALSDFMIGKPGPGSISEAWHMGLPVIVECNARTMIQERPNALLIKELGAGIVVKSFRTIDRVIHRLISSNQLDNLRNNVRGLDNRAVFEIPDILAAIMEQPTVGQRPGLKAPRKFARFAKKLRPKKHKI